MAKKPSLLRLCRRSATCGFFGALSTVGALRVPPPGSARDGAPMGSPPSRQSGTDVLGEDEQTRLLDFAAPEEVLLGELAPDVCTPMICLD